MISRWRLISLAIMVLCIGYFVFIFVTLPINIQYKKVAINDRFTDEIGMRIHYCMYDVTDEVEDAMKFLKSEGFEYRPSTPTGINMEEYFLGGNRILGFTSAAILIYDDSTDSIVKRVPLYYFHGMENIAKIGKVYLLVAKYRPGLEMMWRWFVS